jgi:hypothetical protein
MDAEAVVDHREMMDGCETIDRQHHVGGVQRMHQVSDVAVYLLPQVDLLGFIFLIHDQCEIQCRNPWCLRFADFMNHTKACRCCDILYMKGIFHRAGFLQKT